MKKLAVLCSVALSALLLMISGCQTAGENTPAYSGTNGLRGALPTGWQKINNVELEHLIGARLPIPTYLPSGYEIKEVYYKHEPGDSPPSTNILFLISDRQVEWVDSHYTCQLALSLDWNNAGLGLKMPGYPVVVVELEQVAWAEYIPEIRGRLEDKEGEYILWWETYGSPKSLGSTLRLHASNKFPKEELVKIAASTPSSSPSYTPASTPSSQQSSELPLRIVSITSPINPGLSANLVVETLPGTECSAIIDYGPSGNSVLPSRIADGNGKVSWTWPVGKFSGMWQITIKASYGGQSKSIITPFTVR